MTTDPVVWSAPVRYAEVDAQAVVFNAHYLTWCDEAMTALCTARGVPQVVHDVRLVASSLRWFASVRYGDIVSVEVDCAPPGRTSLRVSFDVRVGERDCCHVETTYVRTDADGVPAPWPDDVRAALS